LPYKNGSFNNISAKIQPIDQISMALVYLSIPNNNSGALYHNVTTTGVNYLEGLYLLANPKSHIFNTPLLLYKIFDGLRSQ
jgi:hypothetical protein